MSPAQIAAKLGFSSKCIRQDIQVIYSSWKDEDPETNKQRRLLRIRQLEGIAQQALSDYDRSRKDSEELRFVTRPCDKCAGPGEDPTAPPCQKCGGKGSYQAEMTASIKQREGEAVFLKVAADCFKEAARLEGLYEKKVVKHVTGNVAHAHAHAHVHTIVPGEFLGASDDEIINARLLLEDLRRKRA